MDIISRNKQHIIQDSNLEKFLENRANLGFVEHDSNHEDLNHLDKLNMAVTNIDPGFNDLREGDDDV